MTRRPCHSMPAATWQAASVRMTDLPVPGRPETVVNSPLPKTPLMKVAFGFASAMSVNQVRSNRAGRTAPGSLSLATICSGAGP